YLEQKSHVTVRLHSIAPLAWPFGSLVVQEFLARVALEGLCHRRISRMYSDCSIPANERVGSQHVFTPRSLRFSGIFVVRGGSGLWSIAARHQDSWPTL